MRCKFLLTIAILIGATAQADYVTSLPPLPIGDKKGALLGSKEIAQLGGAPAQEVLIAGKWHLSADSRMTLIENAYRYHDLVVVFGWAGNYNSLVTILDSNTGAQRLELFVRERSRMITPDGFLVYEHWQVKDAFDPDGSIWMIDLNQPLPFPTDSQSAKMPPGIEDDRRGGVRLYPSESGPNVKHSLSDPEFSVGRRDLYLADWLTAPSPHGGPVQIKPDQICFVRIILSDGPKESHRCSTTEQLFRGLQASQIDDQKRVFRINSAKELEYSVTTVPESGSKTLTLILHPDTLEARPATKDWVSLADRPQTLESHLPERKGLEIPPGTKYIRVGEQVQAVMLLSTEPVLTWQGAEATVRFEALIGQDGRVEKLLFVDGPPSLIPIAEQAARRGVYKQTVLDGDRVAVLTTISIKFKSASQAQP